MVHRQRLKSRTGVIVLLGAIFSFLGLTYLLNNLATKNVDLVLQSFEVKSAIERVLTTMVDAETGQRGFIITLNRDFLEPYERAKTEARSEIETIQRLVAGNPAQMSRLQELSILWDAKYNELEETIELASNNNMSKAVEIVIAAKGKLFMDKIRNKVSDLKDQENSLLEDRSKDLKQQRLWAATLLVLGIVSLILLAWQEAKRFYEQNIGLLASNIELDKLVEERTEQLELEKQRVIALLQDVTHRVGNNLSMVSALLSIQGRKTKNLEVKDALSDARARISAIAAGQRRLKLDIETDVVRAKTYLENLLSETVTVAKERGISLNYTIDDIALPGKDAVSYIVLTNELATNSLKHAFPRSMNGEINVSLGMKKIGHHDFIELVVEDDGVGSDDSGTKSGLGHTIIQSLLKTMDATLETNTRWPFEKRRGHRSVVRIPVASRALEAA